MDLPVTAAAIVVTGRVSIPWWISRLPGWAKVTRRAVVRPAVGIRVPRRRRRVVTAVRIVVPAPRRRGRVVVHGSPRGGAVPASTIIIVIATRAPVAVAVGAVATRAITARRRRATAVVVIHGGSGVATAPSESRRARSATRLGDVGLRLCSPRQPLTVQAGSASGKGGGEWRGQTYILDTLDVTALKFETIQLLDGGPQIRGRLELDKAVSG